MPPVNYFKTDPREWRNELWQLTVSTNSVAAQQASTYTAAKTDHTEKRVRAAQRPIPVSYMRRVPVRHPARLQRRPITHLSNKLKADAEQRTSQLRSLVEKMMTKQGVAIGTADSMWSFLAKGNFTVDGSHQGTGAGRYR